MSSFLDSKANLLFTFYWIKMDHDDFLGTLNKFIQITNDIIEKLKEELDWINGHHNRCIAAKSVGTATSVAGSAVLIGSLLLAPFTGNKLYKIMME